MWLLMFGLAGSRRGERPLAGTPEARAEFFTDPGGRLSFADTAALSKAAWRAWDGRDYIRAARGETLWVRVTLRNDGASPLRAVLEDTTYFTDRIEAAAPGVGAMVSGEAVPAADKPLWGRTAAFPVDVPARGESVMLLRADDRSGVSLRPVWWPREADFHAARSRDILAESLCLGWLVALALYNAALWFRTRHPDTGFYAAYAAAAAGFNFLSNGGPALLGFGLGSPWKEMTVVVSIVAAGLCLIAFSRAFLSTGLVAPRFDRVIAGCRLALFAVLAGVVAMPFIGPLSWLNLAVALILATHATLLAAAVAVWRRGERQARFFVAAFGLLFLGVAPAAFARMAGGSPADEARGLLAMSCLEMLVLSFSVADRFAAAQRRLIAETERRRQVEEAYADDLETEVRERTRELERANADKDLMLAVLGHDLRGPLAGMMRVADGDAGEPARETSRTARTLLLLIEDLVLWARLRAGSRRVGAHPVDALAAPAVALHRSLAERDGVRLVVDLPAGLRVMTDLVLVQTLLRNLLANALKFAATTVELRATREDDGTVRFAVINDGAPLPPEIAARFFADRDEPMTATGGLGLRLCREIARTLEFRIVASSGPGGVVFAFTLPAVPEAVSPAS